MNKTVIRITNLQKIYRLYHNQRSRLLDAFGLLINKTDKFTTHTALDNINLEIKQGEKVAIIGHNGAGKSTLLKLICQVIKPTSGEIIINGTVHPLLEIGTGFLPDFTGRENVIAYLSNLGIKGNVANQKFDEIVDFAELEKYIDQPTKTYSTGMKMRLMFAASTSIKPDILLLDEVLSVGDAYFSQKCHNRIKELCTGDTTLLLVTHDFFSAMTICNRFILLDRGKVKGDGQSSHIHQIYANSIREQKEERLRYKRLNTINKQNYKHVYFGEIIGDKLEGDLYLSNIRIHSDTQDIASSSIYEDNKIFQLITDKTESNWGDIVSWKEKKSRQYLNHGSIYHKLKFVLTFDQANLLADMSNVNFTIEHFSSRDNIIEIKLFSNSLPDIFTGNISLHGTDDWQLTSTVLSRMEDANKGLNGDIPDSLKRYGTKAIELDNITFLDKLLNEKYIFDAGSEITIRMNYRINSNTIDECPIICATFEKDGITRTHRIISDNLRFSAVKNKRGYIDVKLNPILFSPGTYHVSFTIFKQGYFEKDRKSEFFSASNEIYDFHLCTHEIEIINLEDSPLTRDVYFIHPSSWIIHN